MVFWQSVTLIVSCYLLLEILFAIWIKVTRKRFQWLITQEDEYPKLSQEGLQSFFKKGFDPELGWVRKPDTSGHEKGRFDNVFWTIDSEGSRSNREFENMKPKISCYGDSFTFCRQVNDNETWEYFLSKLLNTNVLNFGVGNYGIDQAFLRIQREYQKNPTKFVILGVVPDTISRIMSMWKHYYEYGNTFGFKPRFIIENNSLKLIQNPINTREKFYHYEQYLSQIQKLDFFYKNKFCKEKIKAPYFIYSLINLYRTFFVLFRVSIIELAKKLNLSTSKFDGKPMSLIMKINLSWRVKLYRNKDCLNLLTCIIKEYSLFAKQNNFIPIFVFLPQKDDILFIKNNYDFLFDLTSQITKINDIRIIDVISEFLKNDDLDSLYSDPTDYGGHLSLKGNQLVAQIIDSQIKLLDSEQ